MRGWKLGSLQAGALLYLLLVWPTAVVAHERTGGVLNDWVGRFFSALACRTQEISVGQSNVGLLITDALDQNYFYRLFEVAPGRSASAPTSVVWPAMEIIGDRTAPPYWTSRNDLVIELATNVIDFPALSPATKPARKPLSFSLIKYLPLVSSDADMPAIYVQSSVYLKSQTRISELLSFDPGLAAVRRTGIDVASPIGQDNVKTVYPFVTDSNDDVVRLVSVAASPWLRLELYNLRQHKWSPLALPAVPLSAKFLSLRRTRRDMFEVAVLERGRGTEPDRIVLFGEAPNVLAQGQIERVEVAHSGEDIYGYFGVDGRFVPIANHNRSSAVRFWLDKFAKMDGLIDFGFLRDGNVAVVKRHIGAAAPDVAIISYGGGAPRTLYESCANVSRGVGRIVSSELGFLFLPQERARDDNRLVVYLHDGPRNEVDANGNWVTDAFTLAGHPVLAVNYTVNSGNWSTSNGRHNLDGVLASDIVNGVTFANRALGRRKSKLVIVGDGLGSLVGLASIATQRVQADSFIGLEGIVDSGRLVAEGSPIASGPLGQYISSTIGELHVAPEQLIMRAHATKFLFIHGANDVIAPRIDIEGFISNFNALGPATPAQLDIIPEMYHEPRTRSEFAAILRSIEKFMGD